MLKIECDNPELTRELARLATDVEKAGAFFHEGLLLKALNGDFSIHSSVPADKKELLMSIPEAVFASYEGVEFSLSGNDLVIGKGIEKLEPKAQERLKNVVKIFNLTKKVEKYKTASPRVVFQNDPDFLKILTEPRAGTKIAANTLETLEAENTDQVIINSFLKTRNFNFGNVTRRIIPFIDFTNHHIRARPFDRKTDQTGKGYMALINYKPVTGDSQVYARYGKWDACDTYLMFGFCGDENAFVRSVPAKIVLDGLGTIKVNSQAGGNFKGALPEKLADLKPLFPRLFKFTPGEVELSSLMIPTRARPLSLKRILASIITQMAPDLGQEDIGRYVGIAEFQLLTATREAFEKVLGACEERREKYHSVPAFREAVKMAKLQIRGVEEYQEFSKTIVDPENSQIGVPGPA